MLPPGDVAAPAPPALLPPDAVAALGPAAAGGTAGAAAAAAAAEAGLPPPTARARTLALENVAFAPKIFGGVTLAGPPGVVWEGSWRAHAPGDIVSLTPIADSGRHALLSGSQDGLARIWDPCGRLLGTLDPHPR
jgi:hypothetical protein